MGKRDLEREGRNLTVSTSGRRKTGDSVRCKAKKKPEEIKRI